MNKYLKEPVFLVLTDAVEQRQSVVTRIERSSFGNYIANEEVTNYRDLKIIQKRIKNTKPSSLDFDNGSGLNFLTADNINFAKIYGRKFAETLVSFCKLRRNKRLTVVPCKLFDKSDKWSEKNTNKKIEILRSYSY